MRLYKTQQHCPTTINQQHQQPKNQKRYPKRPKGHHKTTRQKPKTPTQIKTPHNKKPAANTATQHYNKPK
jgi:hypothetical protein